MHLGKRKSGAGPEWNGEELKLHVVFEKEGDKHWPISVKIHVHQDQERQIYLSEVIWRLKQQSFNDYSNSSVSYFHEERKVYVFGCMIPADLKDQDLFHQEKYRKKIHISALSSGITGEQNLKLRFRRKIGTKLDLLKEEQKSKHSVDVQNLEGKQTKQKEKTIQEVIQKVALWRKLYTGFFNESGEVVNMDLQTAATQIGIVKKTLDDYLLQIRNGKRYGFNFERRKRQKIGELRSFVKEHKMDDDKGKRK